MKTHPNFIDYVRRFGVLAGIIFWAVSARANPISLPEKSFTPEITFLVGSAILLEVVCVWLILRRSRRPRFFILWLIGMHLLTYPAFLGLIWLLQDMRPAFAVASGEGLVVLVEGGLIYLICRYAPPVKGGLPKASPLRCWLASLAGNACSLVAFPLLMKLYDVISHG